MCDSLEQSRTAVLKVCLDFFQLMMICMQVLLRVSLNTLTVYKKTSPTAGQVVRFIIAPEVLPSGMCARRHTWLTSLTPTHVNISMNICLSLNRQILVQGRYSSRPCAMRLHLLLLLVLHRWEWLRTSSKVMKTLHKNEEAQRDRRVWKKGKKKRKKKKDPHLVRLNPGSYVGTRL